MIGNDSIKFDISIENLWRAWMAYKKGKQHSPEYEIFSFNIEAELAQLHNDLVSGSYKHGTYRYFEVTDNKRRTIVVAQYRDRVVHRLLYEYLIAMYDKTFMYDAWSCRKDKGLHGAIKRTQSFLKGHKDDFFWRSDVTKFFDSVDQVVLLRLVQRRVRDTIALELIKKVIFSYNSNVGVGRGMPIGNLTSQIFANIYMNELDRFAVHDLKVEHYLRYGDDFVIFSKDRRDLLHKRQQIIEYLWSILYLQVNLKSDIIEKSKHGIKYLGCWVYPNGVKLTNRNLVRIKYRLNLKNMPSYYGIINNYHPKIIPQIVWRSELCISENN